MRRKTSTVWLSEPENLQLLGDALGLTLEFVEREVPVGNFKLDILARETEDDASVIIENQLYWTNHSHLGQTITYAADKEAKYVIWIASSFRPEHRTAIDWLNSLAPEQVWFYAVEIHAIKIGNSFPVPDFRPVAVPRKWNGSTRNAVPTKADEAPPLDKERYAAFFQPMMTNLRELGFTTEFEANAERWLDLDSGLEVEGYEDWAYYGVCLDDWYRVRPEEAYGRAWVYLWFNYSKDFIDKTYEQIKEHRVEIDAEFGAELDWWRIDRRWNIAAVRIEMAGSIDDSPEKQDEIRDWMLETLPKFRDVFNPRLEKILAELDEGIGRGRMAPDV